MNIYNLQEFKCVQCQHWFHPRRAQPYALPCSHALCAPCLLAAPTSSIYCPHHQTSTPASKLVVNRHLLDALERLMKSTGEGEGEGREVVTPSTVAGKLERMVAEREQDMIAFANLLERIYGNQINRIIHLRNRVRQEVVGHMQGVKQWKMMMQNGGNPYQILEWGKILQHKIKEFNALQLQEMANKVISNPAIVLQPHFTIHNILKQPRKTFKSSVKLHQRNQSGVSKVERRRQKQNQNAFNRMMKTVQSPQKIAPKEQKFTNNIHCKQMSSFKLDSSMEGSIPERGRQSTIPQCTMKNSKLIAQFRLSSSLLQDTNENGQITLRQNQHSKCSLKTKACEKREQKRSRFAQLISSLKLEDELEYSPQVSEQMLLSQAKPEINFLQQCPIQKKQRRNEMQVRQRQTINCQRETNKYIKRMQDARTSEAQLHTTITDSTLELFNFDLKEVDLKCYLEKFDWSQIQTVKLVGTGLQDSQFNILLNSLIHTKVQSLLLPNNELQEISLDALVNFTSINSHLRTVSLQRNNIHPLQGQSRTKIAMLRRRGLTLYI